MSLMSLNKNVTVRFCFKYRFRILAAPPLGFQDPPDVLNIPILENLIFMNGIASCIAANSIFYLSIGIFSKFIQLITNFVFNTFDIDY